MKAITKYSNDCYGFYCYLRNKHKESNEMIEAARKKYNHNMERYYRGIKDALDTILPYFEETNPETVKEFTINEIERKKNLKQNKKKETI